MTLRIRLEFFLKAVIKRLFDIAFASISIVVLSPLLLLGAACVLLKLGRPVLYVQVRAGWRAKPFCMYKFRTMLTSCGQDGVLLPDAARLTAFGRRMRALSIDELPELWNVLRGDMSIVGPRPLLLEYISLYSVDQARRHDVRPGITGWAQINGRNAVSWDEKFALDVWYVENQNMWLDLKIIWLTLFRVLRRDGIAAAGEATMSKFTGSKP